MTSRDPITLPQLQHKARELADAGGTATLPAATIPGAVSDLRAALAQQVSGQLQLGSERQALAMLDPAGSVHTPVDVRELLSGSAAAAALRAAAAGHLKPGNARRRVERLLEALVGLPARAPQARHTAEPPAAWAPVISAVMTAAETSPTTRDATRWRNVATGVRTLAARGTVHGLVDPWALPPDYDALCRTLASWGITTVAQYVWVLRQAGNAVRADASVLVALPSWTRESGGVATRARIAGEMPVFAQGLALWGKRAGLTMPTTRDPASRTQTAHTALRPATVARYEFQVRQWAHALLTLQARGFLPEVTASALTIESPWTVFVSHPGRATVDPASDPDVIALNAASEPDAAVRDADMVASPLTCNPVTRAPLALVVAELAVDAGDIWPRACRIERDLPPSTIQMLFALVSVAERVAIARQGDNGPLVRDLRATWAGEMRVLKGGLTRVNGCRKKPEDMLRMLTLPQLVCGVLPWFTLVQLRELRGTAVRTAAAAAREGASAGSVTSAARARKAFAEALQRWLVLASFTCDPVRGTNLSNARVGAEISLDATWNPDGSLHSVQRIASSFEAHGKSDVTQLETKNNSAVANWLWMPAIISHRWVAVYLTELWLPALVRRGLVADGTSLREAVESGRFAYMVNEDGRGGVSAVPGAFGALGEVSNIFADALIVGLRAIGREVPEDRAACRARWPWLFAPHIIRTLWATYWLGLRGAHGPVRPRGGAGDGEDRVRGIDIACWATGDTEATLRGDYSKVEPTMALLVRSPLKSFEHPAAFDEQMDAMWWRTPITWSVQWRRSSVPIPEALRATFLAVDAGMSRPGTAHRRRGQRPVPSR